MHAALAVRDVVDIDGYRNPRAALILELFSEVGHLVLGAELGGSGELPPDLGPFTSRENVVDSAPRNQHGVGSSGGQRGCLFAIGDKAILATRYRKVNWLGQFLFEQRHRSIDLAHVVDEEVWPDDNIIETSSI